MPASKESHYFIHQMNYYTVWEEAHFAPSHSLQKKTKGINCWEEKKCWEPANLVERQFLLFLWQKAGMN